MFCRRSGVERYIVKERIKLIEDELGAKGSDIRINLVNSQSPVVILESN